MPSLRARLVDLALPLLGVRRFFAQTDRMDQRIARMRRRATPRPRRRWQTRYAITESPGPGCPRSEWRRRDDAGNAAPHILYLHGGGYVMDIAPFHWDAIGTLCDRAGAEATVPLYPLAPESKASATLAQIEAVYDDLAARVGSERLVVMGDSAGGGMALALAQRLKAAGKPLPSCLVLFSPWVDATASDPEMAAIAPRDRLLAIAGLAACGDRYRGELPLDDPALSPLNGELAGLPPTLVIAGSHDILVCDARRLVARLDPPATYREYEGLPHVFMILPIPEAQQALGEAARFITAQRKDG